MRCEAEADTRPVVSVVTPTYNRAAYLAETIASVLGQDEPRIEHIVLDDGSTDGTAELLAGFGDRIRAVSHPNMGEQRTVNRGFELARGEFVMVVNSDDPLRPGAVAALVEVMRNRPELVAAYPDWELIDAEGGVVETIRCAEFDRNELLVRHQCMIGPGAIVRREVIERVGGRDPAYRFVADFDFWLRVADAGPIARVPRALATWRRHDDGASHAHLGRAMAAEHVRVVRRAFQRPGVDQSKRRAAMSWAHYAAAYHAGGSFALRLWHAAMFVVTRPANVGRWWGLMGERGSRGSRIGAIVDRARGRVGGHA